MQHRRMSLGQPIATAGELPTRSYHCNMNKASNLLPSSVVVNRRSSLTLSQQHHEGTTTGFLSRTQQRLLRRSRSLDDDPDDVFVDPEGYEKPHRNSMVHTTKTSFRWTLKSMLSSSSLRGSSSHHRQTPQQCLNEILISRGLLISVGEPQDFTLFIKAPTPLQVASYGDYVTGLVHSQDATALQLALSCGLSPNPDNGKDESLLHLVCRLGECDLLRVLLDYGCTLRVVNQETGRTPLHEACWAGHFNVFQQLVQSDSTLLFITDARGSTPLSYIPQKQWKQYIDWIQSHQDSLWPYDDMTDAIDTSTTDDIPITVPPHHQPLPLHLARMLATGRMLPSEVERYVYRPQLTRAISKSDVNDGDDDECMEEQ